MGRMTNEERQQRTLWAEYVIEALVGRETIHELIETKWGVFEKLVEVLSEQMDSAQLRSLHAALEA